MFHENKETLFTHNIRLNPAAWLAHNNLAIALTEKKKYKEAIAHFEQAVELDPESRQFQHNLNKLREMDGSQRLFLTFPSPYLRQIDIFPIGGRAKRGRRGALDLQILLARPNSLPEGTGCGAWDRPKVLKAGSRATEHFEPGQGREAAALRGLFRAPRGRLAGAGSRYSARSSFFGGWVRGRHIYLNRRSRG